MTSQITSSNIDGTFPVAGQDNPSQGFRDNFTNTKNNFLFAQSEINDLQSKALVTSALNGQSINNDMAGTQIIRPQLSAWTQTLLDLGNVSSSAILDFNSANFQKITTAGSISIDFQNWPTSTGVGALGNTLSVSVCDNSTDFAGWDYKSYFSSNSSIRYSNKSVRSSISFSSNSRFGLKKS